MAQKLSLVLALILVLSGCSEKRKILMQSVSDALNSVPLPSADSCQMVGASTVAVGPGENFDVDMVVCPTSVDVTNAIVSIVSDSASQNDPNNTFVRWREKVVGGVTKKVLNIKGFTLSPGWFRQYMVHNVPVSSDVNESFSFQLNVANAWALTTSMEYFNMDILGSAYACSVGGVNGYYRLQCPKGSMPRIASLGAGVVVPHCQIGRESTPGVYPSLSSLSSAFTAAGFAANTLGVDEVACVNSQYVAKSVSFVPVSAAGSNNSLQCYDAVTNTSASVPVMFSQIALLFAPGTNTPPGSSCTGGGSSAITQTQACGAMGVIQNSYGAQDPVGGAAAYGWTKYSVQGPYPASNVQWSVSPAAGISYVPSNGLAANQEIRYLNQGTYTVQSDFQVTAGQNNFTCKKSVSVNVGVPGGASPGQALSCSGVTIVAGATGNAYGPVSLGAAPGNYSWYRFSVSSTDGLLSNAVWSHTPSAGGIMLATATPEMNQEFRFTTSGVRSVGVTVRLTKNGMSTNCSPTAARITVSVPTGTPTPTPTPPVTQVPGERV